METSSERLKIQWDTYVRVHEERLDAETAFREIKGRDPRPLLLLRDCDFCAGRDDAMLEQSLEDERILLASRWFHCVRVDRGVLSESHPLNALFEGNDPAHILFFTADGSERHELPGRPSARRLWSVMNRVLRKDYQGNADRAVSRWVALLSRFDHLDARRAELQERLEREQERERNPRRVEAVERDLRGIEQQLAEAIEEEQRLIDLGLRNPGGLGGAATAVDHDAEAAEAVSGASGRSSLLDRIRRASEGGQNEPEPERR